MSVTNFVLVIFYFNNELKYNNLGCSYQILFKIHNLYYTKLAILKAK